MISLNDTVALMQAVERFKTPASMLLDTFSRLSRKWLQHPQSRLITEREHVAWLR